MNSSPDESSALLTAQDVRVEYGRRFGFGFRARPKLVAVDGVSFDLFRGETLGLVGESGCGKSSLAHAMLQLTTLHGGRVLFQGEDVAKFSKKDLNRFRRRVQIVFQDPYGSLNPRMSAREIVGEGLRIHRMARGLEWTKRVDRLLEQVGLSPAQGERRPEAFSGGQRQRLGIARALALEPEILVCDEPVSALDVSVQAQVLNLMKDLQEELGLAFLFISHDLSVIRQMSDRVAVMYLGKIVELGPAEQVFGAPRHPYTRALLDSVPQPFGGRKRARRVILGEVPDPVSRPTGCVFHPRCPWREEKCDREEPPWRATGAYGDSLRGDGFRCVVDSESAPHSKEQ